MSMADVDLAVIGSGFGGSLMSLIAHRLGRSVILLERGQHPRFAIGESSTPLANLLLEELATRYDLPRVRPLSKWGSWQRTYPNVACGLKRGFTFLHHTAGERFERDPSRHNQLLMAGSPTDEIADTHWYRPHFDEFLVREAQTAGVEYVDRWNLVDISVGDRSVQLHGQRLGQDLSVRARFVLDASGPRGALHRALALPETSWDHLPGTQALFSHFRGVPRLEDLGVMPPGEPPPYPVDDAAVHHVFAGGWVWVLRFNNGLTSAGVAVEDALAEPLKLSEGQPAWERLLVSYPTLLEQFAGASAELPFTHMPRLSFRSGRMSGENWALLPSAAGFLDPLFSTGFTLTLLGVARFGEAIDRGWGTGRFQEEVREYARRSTLEMLAAERLIAALYASMPDFGQFVSISLLYFAAVSFAEISARLGRRPAAGSFLLHDHPHFGPRAQACCEAVLRGPFRRANPEAGGRLREAVLEAIAPIDIIGLSDQSRRQWYAARNDDLLAACGKIGVGLGEMAAFLRR